MKTVTAETILRRLKKEVAANLVLLERLHDPRSQGQREALHHVQTFLRSQVAANPHSRFDS